MENKRNKGLQLEQHISEIISLLDSNARPTKASGGSTEIGDVKSNLFYVECKRKLTKKNIIVDYKKEYLKLLRKIPINKPKLILLAVENSENERFIIMPIDDFEILIRRLKYER